MQIGGSALRLPTPALLDLMTACPTLTALLLRYAHVLMVQVAPSALADGRYSIEIEWPCLRISLARRIWPKAGCSKDSSIITASSSGGVRLANNGLRRV